MSATKVKITANDKETTVCANIENNIHISLRFITVNAIDAKGNKIYCRIPIDSMIFKSNESLVNDILYPNPCNDWSKEYD